MGGEVSEEEFLEAAGLLTDELTESSMRHMGKTEADLVRLVMMLGSILLVFFLFLYFGIESFAAGSSFGALINSFIAALGGIVGSVGSADGVDEGGSEDEDEEEKGDDHLRENIANAIEESIAAQLNKPSEHIE